MPSTPTVSMCAFSISAAPPPLPRAVATTLGRPGSRLVELDLEAASLSQAATNSAISASPAPPGTRSGFTESIATSAATSSSDLMGS